MVARSLGMREAPGSNPGRSICYYLLIETFINDILLFNNMAVSVSYQNLIKLLDKFNKMYMNAEPIVFGSFALPYYIKKRGINLDKIRETGDIDFLVDEPMERLLFNYMGEKKNLKMTSEGSYYQPVDILGYDNDSYFEFIPFNVLVDLCPKNYGRLVDFLRDKQNLEKEEEFNVYFPKEWLWLGLKLAAYRKDKKDKHLTDIIFLKGAVGEKEFNELINELKNHGFEELVAQLSNILHDYED